jgi:adenylosuccinate lyase
MAAIWSDESKYRTWLEVEIAVCEAWALAGRIPSEALQRIRQARFDIDQIASYEREMHHDFNIPPVRGRQRWRRRPLYTLRAYLI